MQDESLTKTVELSTYEMLTLVAKLPTLMRDAGRVGPVEHQALKRVLTKLQAAV